MSAVDEFLAEMDLLALADAVGVLTVPRRNEPADDVFSIRVPEAVVDLVTGRDDFTEGS